MRLYFVTSSSFDVLKLTSGIGDTISRETTLWGTTSRETTLWGTTLWGTTLWGTTLRGTTSRESTLWWRISWENPTSCFTTSRFGVFAKGDNMWGTKKVSKIFPKLKFSKMSSSFLPFPIFASSRLFRLFFFSFFRSSLSIRYIANFMKSLLPTKLVVVLIGHTHFKKWINNLELQFKTTKSWWNNFGQNYYRGLRKCYHNKFIKKINF